jgi:uncharacterized membrane protein YccC
MPSVAFRTRISQITVMVGVAFLFYQITNWEQGIWILFSTMVVAGPISTFMGFEKAKDRFLGTIVGVLIAFGLESFIYFLPSLLPVVGVVLAMVLGFMMTGPYKLFIIAITTCTCLGYTYMNMPYTSFEPVSFVVYRLLGVFAGVMIFLVLQQLVFGTGNAKLELLESSHNTLLKLQSALRQYEADQSRITAYQCATAIFSDSKYINNCVNTAHNVLGSGGQSELREARKVLMLGNRAIRLLVDEPGVPIQKIYKLLHVVNLKLAKMEEG